MYSNPLFFAGSKMHEDSVDSLVNAEMRPPLSKVPKCNGYTARFFIRLFICELLGVMNISFCLTVFTTFEEIAFSVTTLVAFAYGITVWLCGPITGPLINTSLSVVQLMTRRVAYPYVIVGFLAQLIGGMGGCGFAILLTGKYPDDTHHYGMPIIPETSTVGRALGIEIIGTFILMILVLCTVDEFRNEAWCNGHVTVFAFMIVLAVIMVGPLTAPFSGVGLNPLMTLGCAIVNNYYKHQWVHVFGPIIGTVIAVLLYEMVLSNGASLARTRHWWTDPDFDRTINYKQYERKRREVEHLDF
jgi:glycerol uptake facilitator-like aquaporin